MIQGTLRTDAFDSGMSMTTMHGGAAVGVNRNFSVAGEIDIGGSLTNSPGGGSQIGFAGAGNRVRGDLSIVPPLRVAGGTEVERDLVAQGALDVQGSLQIGRDLVLPPDATMAGNIVVAGTTRRESVSIPTPCDCGDRLDIAGIVAAGVAAADDGFDRDALSSITGPNQTVEIPCGRFDVSNINVRGGLTLRVHGRTALFIDGSLTVSGSLGVDLGDTGELDIFVAGSLTIMGNATFGSSSRPAAVRIYVAENVELAGGSELAGNLYAPNAHVNPQGTYEVYGSLFANTIQAAGDLIVHYDRAVLRVDEECDTPTPENCTECDDCGRNACIDGECGPCRSDADCCAPLVCYANGTCGPLLF
jgi:cytoskeletal protein CcmA (bactofilin family)